MIANLRLVRFATVKTSKRLVNLQPVKVTFDAEDQRVRKPVKVSRLNQQDLNIVQWEDWRKLPFDKLCSLPTSIHQKIYYNLKKQKFNVSLQELEESIERASQDPKVGKQLLQMTDYYRNLYELLTNRQQYQNETLIKERYLAKIDFQEPLQDEKLIETVQRFISSMTQPAKLQGFVQPNFVKRLLGINRDLKIRGVQLEPIRNEPIKLIKIVNYEYEFWADVSQNRSKNQNIDEFIVQQKQVQNPNESMLVKEQYPSIKMKYIVRRRKQKDYQMCFCTKAQILVSINKHQHIIKVQWIGPRQEKKHLSQSKNTENKEIKQYRIIDFDFIAKGNPTIRPIFDL